MSDGWVVYDVVVAPLEETPQLRVGCLVDS